MCKCLMVINTGDLDVLPAIEKVLTTTSCDIELYACLQQPVFIE